MALVVFAFSRRGLFGLERLRLALGFLRCLARRFALDTRPRLALLGGFLQDVDTPLRVDGQR